MATDAKDRTIKVGDRVMVPCIVTDAGEGGGGADIAVVVELSKVPEAERRRIRLSGRHVILSPETLVLRNL